MILRYNYSDTMAYICHIQNTFCIMIGVIYNDRLINDRSIWAQITNKDPINDCKP